MQFRNFFVNLNQMIQFRYFFLFFSLLSFLNPSQLINQIFPLQVNPFSYRFFLALQLFF